MSSKAKKKWKNPRPGYSELGLSPERLQTVRDRCRSGVFSNEEMRQACSGFEWIADFIIRSAMEDMSYDRLEFFTEWGRISCGRSDFYSYRRLFFANLDKVLREKEALGE